MAVTVQICLAEHARALKVPPGIPAPATPGSAGLDLCACLEQPLVLKPMARAKVPTGWCVAIPHGFEGQVRPRSGLADRHGVTVLNAPGTIDSDYRGEVCVLLVNLSADPYTVQPGDRIAQLIIAPVQLNVSVDVVKSLPATQRGAGGFGSTGRGSPPSSSSRREDV